MSWVDVPAGSHFPATNLPYGVVSGEPVVRIGDLVLALARCPGLPHRELFEADTLNPFLAAGPVGWASVRAHLQTLFTDAAHQRAIEPLLEPVRTPSMPFAVADYVDFYASEHHASNVGRMFRPDGEPLLPNWKHLPVGYHGRAGTVVVSGTGVTRPSGQLRAGVFGPSARLDIEAEVGFVVGVGSEMGAPSGGFAEHVFGAVLVNDWSARDIQAWEYVPLGPFLGKSFATSVSPWVVPMEALRAARVPGPPQSPEPLEYLRDPEPRALDLAIEVRLNGHLVSSPPFASMYWSAAQQFAHLTVNGASLRTGDLFASGTVSGPEKHQRGSLLELTWAGAEPIDLPGGETRAFLQDGDIVDISATAPGAGGSRIGFGAVSGEILPARR